MALAEGESPEATGAGRWDGAGRTPIRVVVVLGAVVVAALLALEMSGSARRTVGTNLVQEPGFAAIMPHGGRICQSQVPLPAAAGYARVQIGSYDRRMPAIDLTFTGPGGRVLATGHLSAGHAQGQVDVPMSTPTAAETGTLCLRFASAEKLAVAGLLLGHGPGSAQVNGKSADGPIGIRFVSRNRESWWDMLGTLARRFDYGKAGWIGSLTLPLVCLVMLAVWILALQRLWRLRS